MSKVILVWDQVYLFLTSVFDENFKFCFQKYQFDILETYLNLERRIFRRLKIAKCEYEVEMDFYPNLYQWNFVLSNRMQMPKDHLKNRR